MHLVRFIASRLSGRKTGRVSRPAIVVATAGVAVGLMVMVLTVCVTHGFKSEIRQQVRGVGGDLQLVNTLALSDGESPLTMSAEDVAAIRGFDGVERAERVACRIGCLKTDSAFAGIQLVGIEQAQALGDKQDEDSSKTRQLSDDEIVISTTQASRLRLNVGDRVMAYFFDESIRARRFTVVDTYCTNMSDFDDTQVFASFATVHALAGYADDECSAVRIFRDIERTSAPTGLFGFQAQADIDVAWLMSLLSYARQVRPATPFSQCTVQTLEERYPQVFSWLQLLDMNVWIILVLMVCVSGFTMASGLFILILERTQMIGLMKAMGARFGTLRGVFLYLAGKILVRGMLIGNAIALLLVFMQQRWQVLHLNPADYYVDAIPVVVPWAQVALINAGTLLITIAVLVIPTYIINRIKPVKALRFE